MRKRLWVFGLILSMLVSILPQQTITAETVTAEANDYLFRVLELAPEHGDFVLKTSDFTSNIKLYQYSVKEYNAIREDMVGKYDIIYISNGNSDNAQYSTLGDPVESLPPGGSNGSVVWQVSSLPMYEYWPGNDATELLIGYLEKLKASGAVLMADKDFEKFNSVDARITAFVRNNIASDHFVKRPGEGGKKKDVVTAINGLINFNDFNMYGLLRPYLNITDQPTEFDGSDDSYIRTSGGTILSFTYDALSFTGETNFDVDFYFDINGDNKYYAADYELIKHLDGVAGAEGLNFSLAIPSGFKGLMPYKFEITDNLTGAKNYKTGYLGFRGDAPIEVNVLQITCNGNTFSLKTDLKDEYNNNLLTAFSDDYKIKVDELSMYSFKQLYNDPSFNLASYIGPGRSKPYNMIIFGFADMYGRADITEAYIADDIKDFINTGQSVMFTHDNLSFQVGGTGWSTGITKYFRDFVGQNIYATSPMPNADKYTMGFSDMAFIRARYGWFSTTNRVYATNDGIMTNYPFALVSGDKELYDLSYNERLLSVATTHYQYYQLDLNDEDVVVWYTLTDGSNDIHDPGNYYYTYSIGNVTYSGTGHSNLSSANAYAERRLFVNTIIKAIRGANFAPEIEIQGVTNGANVSVSKDRMTFDIIASDPDINDQYLDGVVYFDKNGDGNYTADEIIAQYDRTDLSDGEHRALESGIPKTVTLDLTDITGSPSKFGFKVVVTDQGGATSTKEYRFPLVNSPTVNLSVETKVNGVNVSGMLLGDGSAIINSVGTYDIPALSVESLIKDISFRTGIYSDSDHGLLLDLQDTTKYTITNYTSSGLGVNGDLLEGSHANIINPVIGTNQPINDWQYTFTPAQAGTYYLESNLSYGLEVYHISDATTYGKSFKVRKGEIQFNIKDDFGATPDSTIHTHLYRFDSMSDIGDPLNPSYNKATLVGDYDTSDGAVKTSDDPSEKLKSGYYILKVDEGDGFGEGVSSVVTLNVDNPVDQVDVEVTSQPISNLKWLHVGNDTEGATKMLRSGEVSYSNMVFDTYKAFSEFEMSYNDVDAAYMTMDEFAVYYDDQTGSGEVDVTSKFNHDASANTISWNDSNKMGIGAYRVVFRHRFNATAPDGRLSEYNILPDVEVEILDAENNPVTKTYSFPTLENDSRKLKFLKEIVIL